MGARGESAGDALGRFDTAARGSSLGMDIAIVGAGMAGLACGQALRAAGHGVVLFDKGRRPSGRMAARTIDAGAARFAFDYGAQYMTARDPAFVAQAAAWQAAGVAAPWLAAGADAWVGTPQMDAPLAAMAATLDVHWSTHVTAIGRDDDGWWLSSDTARFGPYVRLVVALPAEQAAALAAGADDALAALASAHASQPCWTAMFGFDRRIDAPDMLDGDAVIDTALRNPAKPGRSESESWTLHATPEWSVRHIEEDRDTVAGLLLAALTARIGDLPEPVHAAAHRWRYARSGAAGIGRYHDPATGLAACGDWLLAPRVESAWLSGRQAAMAIIGD